MGARGARVEHAHTHMKSPVNWALLGLIIARPSYAFELAHRFEHVYEGALSVSSPSHIYWGLEKLLELGLIVEADDSSDEPSARRFYEATEAGLVEHAAWLAAQVGEERRRQRVVVSQLGALARTPERASKLLDEYEQACLAELADAPAAGEQLAGTTGLIARLAGEETRLSVAAKLRWVQYARAQLGAMTARSATGEGSPGPA
jgi:DNA-binding PadR family transcriptional regulator